MATGAATAIGLCMVRTYSLEVLNNMEHYPFGPRPCDIGNVPFPVAGREWSILRWVHAGRRNARISWRRDRGGCGAA